MISLGERLTLQEIQFLEYFEKREEEKKKLEADKLEEKRILAQSLKRSGLLGMPLVGGSFR